MKFSRTAILVTVGTLLLMACKSKEESALEAAPQNPLLSYVSADTPYLFANLEPTPSEVVDAYLGRFKPTFDLVQTMLDDLHVEIRSDGSSDMNHAALMVAIMNELDGKLNRAGLESLGLSLESHKALYGMGAFPVMRLALKDADALRAAIARVEAEAGFTFTARQAGEISYWRLAEGDEQGGVYIAILPDHLAIGLFPSALENEFLPEFLGQADPVGTFDANGALATLNREKGFLDYGSGYLDFHKLAAEFMLPDSRTNRGLSASGHALTPGFNEVCVTEINGLIDEVPRMVLGTMELSVDAIGIQYQFEMASGLASQLAHLVSDVPTAEESPDNMLAMSLAVQTGRLREFLLEKAMERVSQPFACEQLQTANEMANQALAQMNQPMPPFIGNINGLRLKLQDIDFTNPAPENARGIVVLEVEKPQMLVGSAQMFIPGLENLNLEPGGEPVEVPQELMTLSIDGMHISAAMSKDALALSMGKDQQAGLMGFLEQDGENEGTFFSVSYDMAAQMQFQDHMQAQASSAAAANGEVNPETQQVMDLMQEMADAYRDTLGRARVEFRFTPAGFEIYNQMTFK